MQMSRKQLKVELSTPTDASYSPGPHPLRDIAYFLRYGPQWTPIYRSKLSLPSPPQDLARPTQQQAQEDETHRKQCLSPQTNQKSERGGGSPPPTGGCGLSQRRRQERGLINLHSWAWSFTESTSRPSAQPPFMGPDRQTPNGGHSHDTFVFIE